MKAGELRRFNDNLDSLVAAHASGQTFLVLEVVNNPGGVPRATILVDGKTESGWGYPWVKENSEVISAG